MHGQVYSMSTYMPAGASAETTGIDFAVVLEYPVPPEVASTQICLNIRIVNDQVTDVDNLSCK